ncbi:MAG: response regulator [Chloroflexi bacterium]|uniref:histidine kinase n=1 Tax=Candidatus Chlorohelix allophototropha TaxID=3003348 RepID=A0A8T7M555_9CHLR|nr:response regulator [Chloroflexota bacterium]WJW69156.1 ATP-binding protein [Chloroflexota bacterium L227-S17]
MVKILVIEDEEQIREEVMDWLQFEGYEVSGAANGRLGLEAIQREVPDLIICDIAMPELDGHDVLIEVRSNSTLNHIPFVFLTAAADHDAVRKGMTLGADDYLTKPFTHAEVLNTIRTRLEKRAAQEKQMQSQIEILNTALSEEREKRLLNSRLVAMFSHDFRNPLTCILSSSDILRNYETRLSTEQKAQQFDLINGSVYLLLQMLEDMLMVAEMERNHLEYAPRQLDLKAFVKDLIDEFRLIDQDSHILTFHSGLQGSVEADSKLIRQILTNLISNAIKYSTVRSEVIVTLSEKYNKINLVVEDQGIGIPEEGLANLFEPFYRATNAKNVKGTGLGLSIVKECVECHSGSIRVESQLGKGTIFAVELPLVRG